MRLKSLFIPAALVLCLTLISCKDQPNSNEVKNMSHDNAVVLINPFIVPENQLDDTIIMWEQARDFLQTQPGYISTELHQSLGPDAKFRLINVAKWESAEAFKTASKKMATEANLPKLEGVVASPALFKVIRRD